MTLVPVVWAAGRTPTGSRAACGAASIEADELPRGHVFALDACGPGAAIHDATDHGLDALAAVHDARFLAVLETAYERWVADGHWSDTSPTRSPTVPRRRGHQRRGSGAPAPRSGRTSAATAMDTMTPIGDGTWPRSCRRRRPPPRRTSCWRGALRGVPPSAGLRAATPDPTSSEVVAISTMPPVAAVGKRCMRGERVAVDDRRHHGTACRRSFRTDPPSSTWVRCTSSWCRRGSCPRWVSDEVDPMAPPGRAVAPGTATSAGWPTLDQVVAGVARFDPEAVVVSSASTPPRRTRTVRRGHRRGLRARPPDRRPGPADRARARGRLRAEPPGHPLARAGGVRRG